MKISKKSYAFLIIILLIIIGLILYFYFSNNSDSNNYDTTNVSVEDYQNISEGLTTQIEETTNKIKEDNVEETGISTFTTEIKDNSPGRLTNISITCNTINGTVLEPGQTFSFNEIVGQPTSDRGYQEATVIVDGEHETGIGGGNCQVSSTLYNAVLAVPTLTIIERHEHGGSGVTYVPAGKDAAVSYSSSLDLKFRNDNPYRVRIDLISNDITITATLVKI